MSVLNFPGPAAMFPDEPLDVDPGVQPGDPGPVPPPANLEPVRSVTPPAIAPLAALTDMAVSSTLQASRYQTAMIEMFCGLTSMLNLTGAAVRVMDADDIKFMPAVTGHLTQSLRELLELVEAKQQARH